MVVARHALGEVLPMMISVPGRTGLTKLWRSAFRSVITLFALVLFSASFAVSSAPAAEYSYAVGKHACQTPSKPHQARCLAMIKVVVEKTVPGARAFLPAAGAKAAGTVGPAGGLTPSDLATAYNLPTATAGAGQTVALVDAYNDPNIEADLQVFDSKYGLATCTIANGCLTVVGQVGSTLPQNDTTGWSVEESLDVETVHAICQKCKILLVEANSESNADLGTAENRAAFLKATEISNSFGEPESQADAPFESAFNHPGLVITASTGDDGYYSFDLLTGTNQPNFPASFGSVVSVGGTSLYLGQTAARQSETVWNDNGVKDYFGLTLGEGLGAGGGGCSKIFGAPGWQTHVAGWSSTGCGAKRLSADVAAVADYLTGLDIYDSYACSQCLQNPGWATVGGTSLASPLIASVYALAGGAQGMSHPVLTLYGHLGAAYDVTVGGNGWCDGEGAAACGDPNSLGFGVVDCDYPASGTVPAAGDLACDAAVGFDGPTGVGTPNGLTAFTKTGPKAPISGPTSVKTNVSGTWTATYSDPFPGGTAAQYTWNWGDGSAATVTTTPSAPHTYTTGGVNRTISMVATDNYGVASAANTFTVSVTTAQASW
jgi:hypothetical protein